MKKALLAFLLLAIVVAIAYYRTSRHQGELSDQFSKGVTEGKEALSVYQKRSDSLGSALAMREAQLTDSLHRLESGYQAVVDSMGQVVASKDQEIKRLADRKRAVQSSKPGIKAQKDSTGLSQKHEQILSYYRRRIKELPADLSEYEKRVAVNEVRDETTRKFAITMNELDKICQAVKLTN
ncbi:MAG: hypothetical protein AB1644_01765 [Candidatus Zixiibacteriota bacterium]